MERSAPTGVYSDSQLIEAIADGTIIIRPDDPEYIAAHIAPTGFDVTLGHYYIPTDQQPNHGVYNPRDAVQRADYFGDVREARPLGEISSLAARIGRRAVHGIPEDQPVIVLPAGRRILAHTHEFVGVNQAAMALRARSVPRRNGITVRMDGEQNFDRLTLEIINRNPHDDIPLAVGSRIAQLVFYHTGPIDLRPRRTAEDMAQVVSAWTPDRMLPETPTQPLELPPTIPGLPPGIR